MERVDMETIYEMMCVKTVIRFMGVFTTLTPLEIENLVELRLRCYLALLYTILITNSLSFKFLGLIIQQIQCCNE